MRNNVQRNSGNQPTDVPRLPQHQVWSLFEGRMWFNQLLVFHSELLFFPKTCNRQNRRCIFGRGEQKWLRATICRGTQIWHLSNLNAQVVLAPDLSWGLKIGGQGGAILDHILTRWEKLKSERVVLDFGVSPPMTYMQSQAAFKLWQRYLSFKLCVFLYYEKTFHCKYILSL